MPTIILIIIVIIIFIYLSKGYKKYNDTYKEQFKNFSTSKEAIQASELGLFVALVAKVAKADGRVDALEAELVGNLFTDIAQVFPQPNATREILKQIFNEQKDIFTNTQEIALKLKHLIGHDLNKQISMMGFLIQLAFIDGEVSKSEEKVLIQIAETMQVDPDTYHKIFDEFEAMAQQPTPTTSLDDAYKTLGVLPSDSLDDIKKAYKQLVRQYHPDIIKAQGKNDSYIKQATIKTQEINSAYETIKKSRK